MQYDMQWLRHEGADWPAALQYNGHQWPDASIAWCRTEGCDSPLSLDVQIDTAEVVADPV
jgi:hypothetical protein